MIILGLNAFHGDSAAALVRDGKLIAAAEEERFRRVKHWAGSRGVLGFQSLVELGAAFAAAGLVKLSPHAMRTITALFITLALLFPREGARAREITLLEMMHNCERLETYWRQNPPKPGSASIPDTPAGIC